MSEGTKHKRLGHPYMQNRELSWLEFNKRVLDQSTDDTVPLLDQMNFISIFWSNLKEFFMVRVGSLTDLSLVKKSLIDSKSGMTPSEQLSAVYERCHELYPYYAQCYQNVSRKLAQEGIRNLRKSDLSVEQAEFITDYFYDNIMPFLSPQIINSRHPFPHLENGALYIVVRLDEHAPNSGKKKKGDKVANNRGAEGVTLGLIPLPRQCERMVLVPESGAYSWGSSYGSGAPRGYEGCEFMLLEHVIEMFCEEIFSMYKVKHTNIICVTRNADLDAAEGAEEQGEDYREHMKRILQKRARLAPVRLESERELSSTVKRVLLDKLDLKEHQLFVLPIPLDLSYVEDLPECVGDALRSSLTMAPFSPQWPASLDRNRPMMDQIGEHEVLISYPYETIDAFIRLLREAAADPSVISIKITLYRLASQSHLAEALIAAAEAGKEVTAIFELRARFDESNNIEWSQRFERAGCHVLYGFREYKIHSKICCITRQTPYGLQHITQLGTGNYNEKTARLYTDFCFITADPNIGRDAMAYFRNMALESTSDEYDILWVSPLQIKQNIIGSIDEQIARQRCGMPSGLFFKTNSITDKEIIDKIVEASQAGVTCTLLVRGISCIVPGVEGYTDNVCVVSIVGRLLEHSRIYCFGPLDGNVKIYLSSADLMTRNMDKRIEIAWPIYNASLKSEVIGYIGTCMADTAKLRDLLPNRDYTPLRYFACEDPDTGKLELMDSQEYLIAEAQRRHLEAAALAASLEANRVLDVKDEEAFAANEHASDVPSSAFVTIPGQEPPLPDPEPLEPEQMHPEQAFVPMPGNMFAADVEPAPAYVSELEPGPRFVPEQGLGFMPPEPGFAPEAGFVPEAGFMPEPGFAPELGPEQAFVPDAHPFTALPYAEEPGVAMPTHFAPPQGALAQEPPAQEAFTREISPQEAFAQERFAPEPQMHAAPQVQEAPTAGMEQGFPVQGTVSQQAAVPQTAVSQGAVPQGFATQGAETMQGSTEPAPAMDTTATDIPAMQSPVPGPVQAAVAEHAPLTEGAATAAVPQAESAGQEKPAPQEEVILGRFKMKQPKPFSREEEERLSGIPRLYEISAAMSGSEAASSSSDTDDEFSKADTLDLEEERRKEEEGSRRSSERKRKSFSAQDDVPAYDSIETFFNKTPDSNKFVIPSKKDMFGRPEY